SFVYSPRALSSAPTRLSFTDTAPTPIHTLSLHDALPIFASRLETSLALWSTVTITIAISGASTGSAKQVASLVPACQIAVCGTRSEEHTSELQSRFDLVCRLLLAEKMRGSLRVIAFGRVQ